MPFLKIPNCDLAEIPQRRQDLVDAILAQLSVTPPGQKIIVTVGDMHGNWWKLFSILVYLGLINPTDYAKCLLLNLYGRCITGTLVDYYVEFEMIMNAPWLMVRPVDSLKERIKLVLIGDIFADRGPSDYCTALLLKHAISVGIDIDIIMSNHDALFISALEDPIIFKGLCRDDTASVIELKNDTAKLNQVKNIFYQYLQPHYKMALCYVNTGNSVDRSRMVLLTHAPHNLKTLHEMACGMTTVENSADLQEVICSVNKKLEELLSKKEFRQFVGQHDKIREFVGLRDHSLFNTPTEEISVFGHVGPTMLEEKLFLSLRQYCLDSCWGMPGVVNGDFLVFIDTPCNVNIPNFPLQMAERNHRQKWILQEENERNRLNLPKNGESFRD